MVEEVRKRPSSLLHTKAAGAAPGSAQHGLRLRHAVARRGFALDSARVSAPPPDALLPTVAEALDAPDEGHADGDLVPPGLRVSSWRTMASATVVRRFLEGAGCMVMTAASGGRRC